MRSRQQVIVAWVLTALTLVVTTLALHSVREELRLAHIVLVYELLVIAGTMAGGRWLGVAVSVIGFLLMNAVFSPASFSLNVSRRLDWLVFFAFLLTAAATIYLLSRLQQQARAARRRALEFNRLANIAARPLGAAYATDAVAELAQSIREALDIATCRIEVIQDDAMRDLPDDHQEAFRAGKAVLDFPGGRSETIDAAEPLLWASMPGALRARIPLRLEADVVGFLLLEDEKGMVREFEPRFMGALVSYAALAAERVRVAMILTINYELTQSNKVKDVVIASISHDLRTPLTSIRAVAQQCLDEGQEKARDIVDQADRLNRLVKDVLDLSRIRAGALSATLEENTAEGLIGIVRRDLAALPGASRVRWTIDLEAPALVGHFDLLHSSRIIGNLVQNAVRYTPGDADIEVRVTRDGEELLFEVIDEGPGIPPSEHDRIFQPFYRPRSARPDANAAGLGLAIAKELAEIQHGTLSVRAREQGTIFALRLPATTATL